MVTGKASKVKIATLFSFAIIYQLIMLKYANTITLTSPENVAWLAIINLAPFAVLLIAEHIDWKLAIGLGVIASLTADLTYGTLTWLLWGNVDLWGYYVSLIAPQNESFLTAVTFYLRVAVAFVLFERYKYIPHLGLRQYLSLRRQKVPHGPLKKNVYEPAEIFVVLPEERVLEEKRSKHRLA